MKAVIIVALCVCVIVSEVAGLRRYRPQPKKSEPSDDDSDKGVATDAPRRVRLNNANRGNYTGNPGGRRGRPVNGK
ncbi:hypothetical protein BsWGS_01582 [Bradybaena similaris]